jgi:predicted nucleic acid-binding protein
LSGAIKSYTFDSEPILAFFFAEEGGDVVRDLLEEVRVGEAEGYMCIVNFCEIYYILSRLSFELAEEKQSNLRGYGLKIVPIDDDGLWREAAKIKAKHALSLADAFAVATSKISGSKLVVGGDKEFTKLNAQFLKIRE